MQSGNYAKSLENFIKKLSGLGFNFTIFKAENLPEKDLYKLHN